MYAQYSGFLSWEPGSSWNYWNMGCFHLSIYVGGEGVMVISTYQNLRGVHKETRSWFPGDPGEMKLLSVETMSPNLAHVFMKMQPDQLRQEPREVETSGPGINWKIRTCDWGTYEETHKPDTDDSHL
jgi:hypothetical protein